MMEENSARAALERAREALERALDEARRAVVILNTNRRNPGCAKALHLADLAEHDVSLARAELAASLTSLPATQEQARSGVETALRTEQVEALERVLRCVGLHENSGPVRKYDEEEFSSDLHLSWDLATVARALLAEENK